MLSALALATLVAWPATAIERFVLPGLDGDSLDDADLDQGETLMVVWASWSPRCHDIRQRLQVLHQRWRHEARLVSVVFQEEPEVIRRFLAPDGDDPTAHDLPPIYIDTTGEFSKLQDVATLPTLLVVRRGEVVFRGKLPPDPDPVIERALEDPLP